MTSIYVTLQKFLVIFIVLIRQANLSRHLCVSEQLLRDWRVKLVPLIIDVRQTPWRLAFDRERLLSIHLHIRGHLLSLLIIDRSGNA